MSKRYIPSIDGLRAFAVFAVIFYHLGFPFAKGGLLGVTVFFVISGYLITSLLTAEWESSGTVNLPQFWLRRVRRLFPAIVTVIVVMAAVYTVASPLLLSKMRPDIIPGLFWFENWWYILRDVSYFEAVGAPSPLTHFWSLAIEEQFYLIWPVLLLGVFKLGAGKTTIRRACLVLAVVSAVAMAIMYDPQGDPSRVYYGTDTRAFSLLIGAWLSFAWPSAQLTDHGARMASAGSVAILDVVGVAAFAGVVAMCVFISGFSDFMYYGGLVLCSVLSAIVIAVLVHPRSMFAKVAAWEPFVWIGKRSYGMYLWHFPIICLLQPRNATSLPWWIYLVEIALTVGLSALSYHFIEKPIRTQGLAFFTAPSSAAKGAIASGRGAWGSAASGARGASGVRGVSGGRASRGQTARGGQAGRGGQAARIGRGESGALRAKPSFAAWVQTHIPAVAGTAAVLALALGGIAFSPAVVEGGAAADEQRVMSATLIKPLVDGVYDVVFIGDSVSLGANQQLNEYFPHGMIDTEGNRQYFQGIEILQGYLDKGVVGDTVIMSMGTNGYAEHDELEQVMEMCGPDRTVWFVNTRVPDERCEPNNLAIQACVDAHDNAHLIDWYGASAGHDEWLSEDGVHLTWDGREAYADLVFNTIGYVLPTAANSTYDVTFIGDVVALGAVEQLAALFPYGAVDCSDARTVASSQEAFVGYRDGKVMGSELVLCLGAEEKLEREAVEALLSEIGAQRKVWLVNSRTPYPWCEDNNALLAELADAAANVELIDWFATSTGHDDYLAEDGMNLTSAGAAAYAAMVGNSLGDHTVAPTSDQANNKKDDEGEEADAPAGDAAADAADGNNGQTGAYDQAATQDQAYAYDQTGAYDAAGGVDYVTDANAAQAA